MDFKGVEYTGAKTVQSCEGLQDKPFKKLAKPNFSPAMIKEWTLNEVPDTQAVQELKQSLGVDDIIARLLVHRGIKTFEEARIFFRPDLSQLHDPFLMADMHKAVDRLTQAVCIKEKVLVYGDYDVDGTTAVTLVFSFLKKMGVDCEFYIPDRYTEGYGFSFSGVEHAKANGQSLIITLDCGIKDGKKVELATSYGIDVIICDHHNPSEMPDAYAVLDPKRSDCNYPYKGLSGCGVGFKMLQAYCIQHDIPLDEIYCYLDLLTISIGADIVPLTGENRVLASFGLQQLAGVRRPGISALLHQSGFKKQSIDISDVVFILAPRINAAGRIFSGKQAVQLLLAETLEEALSLSPAIEENNNTRRGLDKEITIDALKQVRSDEFYNQSFSTVVFSDSWHKGVVGIVAARLVTEFYKPAIVLVQIEDKLAGSARSIPGIDLFDALGKCSDLLDQFGGHTMAAGLSMHVENFNAFRQRFDEVVAKTLAHRRPTPSVGIDAEINFEEITPKFFRILQQFQPFGPENMKPVFLTRNIMDAGYTRAVGQTGSHLKFHAKQQGNEKVKLDGIGFDFGPHVPALKMKVLADVVYTLEEHEWNGNTTIQMNIREMKMNGGLPPEAMIYDKSGEDLAALTKPVS